MTITQPPSTGRQRARETTVLAVSYLRVSTKRAEHSAEEGCIKDQHQDPKQYGQDQRQ